MLCNVVIVLTSSSLALFSDSARDMTFESTKQRCPLGVYEVDGVSYQLCGELLDDSPASARGYPMLFIAQPHRRITVVQLIQTPIGAYNCGHNDNIGGNTWPFSRLTSA